MIDPDTEMVWSRVNSEIAIPVLNFEAMMPENNFAAHYNLEKFNAIDICRNLVNVIRTRKIPINIKNHHRKFWEMKLI
jgi:hypothetical protein